jgi:hypothetical protein
VEGDLMAAPKNSIPWAERRCHCGLLYPDHTAGPCPVCHDHLEHHPTDNDGNPDTGPCWEGLARTAHARADTGQALTATDVEAIRRHPNRETLNYLNERITQ